MEVVLFVQDRRFTLRLAGVLGLLVLDAVRAPNSVSAGYTETFQTWSSTSAAAWETKSLSGAPFSVPANAVVEVACRNKRVFDARSGGVRAVGSSLDRRFNVRLASVAGVQLLVMHVQTDSSSQIQHYSQVTADLDFVLLGYWTSGTYVERFDSFTAGASATWTDANLCSYGVRPNYVGEIVMTNVDTGNGRSVGVRTNGSSVDRRFTLDVGWAAALNFTTMFVKADSSALSTIEVYAQDDTDVSFYLVGYWSVAPGAYTEKFSDVGSPSASTTWQDKDLTADGVPDSGTAEFLLANEYTGGAPNLGVRTNGSSLARLLNPHLVFAGNANVARMHVLTDGTATMEWYHSDITRANSFYLLGYWTTCDTSISYGVTDLGAITSTKSSLGWHINSSETVAGFEEDSSGNPAAWYLSCGSFTSLGTLGGSYAESHGINNADMVVGWSTNGSEKRRAFRWTSGGGMVDLGTLSGRSGSEALSVNGNSEIVGTVADFASPPHNRLAFLYLPSAAYGFGSGMNSLGTLGGTQSVAMDISDSGRVVGGAQNGSGYFRPFRWNSGTMTDLGTLGGDSVLPDHRAEAVNSSGNIAGRSYTAAGAARAFYWNGSSMSDLGVLTGGTESWAFGLNDSNVVGGTSNVTGGAFHAFVWDSTNGMRDLNNLISGSSGWTLTRATDIDNNGFITGWGTNPSSKTRAFLLTLTCNGGGGGSAAASAALASGGGVTDDLGTFDGSAVDTQGVELAHVEVLGGHPGVALEYQVIEPLNSLDPMPEPDLATRDGFVGGVGLLRTLKVESTSPIAGLSMTVNMNFTMDEIADLGSAPKELELYVFEKPAGEAEKVWVPAGKNIGESLPTKTVGQSGFALGDGGLVKYWAVRRGGGVFAVGKGRPVDQPATQPAPAPRPCGMAMIQPMLLCCIVLCAARRSRRT